MNESEAVDLFATMYGVDLADVHGTGVGGVVTVGDVKEAAGLGRDYQATPGSSAAFFAGKSRAEVRQIAASGTAFVAASGRLSPHVGADGRAHSHALNPLVDEIRASQPEHAIRASAANNGTVPKLFGNDDLPPFTASGISPNLLAEVPWEGRHALAAEADYAKAYQMYQDFTDPEIGIDTAATEGGLHAGNAAYKRRVEQWRADGLTEADFDAMWDASPFGQAEKRNQEQQAWMAAQIEKSRNSTLGGLV